MDLTTMGEAVSYMVSYVRAPSRFWMRITRKVSQGEGFFLSAKGQSLQWRYMELGV